MSSTTVKDPLARGGYCRGHYLAIAGDIYLARAREPDRSYPAADRIGHWLTRGPPSPAPHRQAQRRFGSLRAPGWERGPGPFPPAGG